MKNRSLVSISDYSKEEILDILHSAADFETDPNRKTLDGKVVATLFFEPSTRTRLPLDMMPVMKQDSSMWKKRMSST